MRTVFIASLLLPIATQGFLLHRGSSVPTTTVTTTPQHRILTTTTTTSLHADAASSKPDDEDNAAPLDIPKLDLPRGGGADATINAGQLQTIAYVFNSLGYAAIAGILLFMPDKTNMARLDAKLGGAAGFAMAALLSNMLAGAAQRATLQRDAYKKVNLGLLAFCAVGIVAVPGESAFTPLQVPGTLLAGFMSMMRVIGGITSYFGWRLGVGNKDVVQELTEGVKKTQASMDLEKKSKGYLYQYSAVAFGFGIANCLLTISKLTSDFDISLQVSTISRLVLAISMLLTLKDANEANKLSGRTFFQMNLMLGAWCFLGTWCGGGGAAAAVRSFVRSPLFIRSC